MKRKLADAALSIRQNSAALLLKCSLLLAEGDVRQSAQLALRAVESGSNIENEKQTTTATTSDDHQHGEKAVLAMIRCQLAEQQQNDKQLKEAHQQLEFLQETHSDVKEQSVNLFLNFILNYFIYYNFILSNSTFSSHCWPNVNINQMTKFFLI